MGHSPGDVPAVCCDVVTLTVPRPLSMCQRATLEGCTPLVAAYRLSKGLHPSKDERASKARLAECAEPKVLSQVALLLLSSGADPNTGSGCTSVLFSAVQCRCVLGVCCEAEV